MLHGRDADARLRAARSILQRYFQVVAQVGAAIDAAASAAAPSAEDISEDVAERICKATGTEAARLRVDAGVAVLVVGRALLRIRQNLVGFLGLLEMLLGFGIIRIAVRMVLHGQLAVGLLDFCLGSVAIESENFVKVFFCHVCLPDGRSCAMAGFSAA